PQGPSKEVPGKGPVSQKKGASPHPRRRPRILLLGGSALALALLAAGWVLFKRPDSSVEPLDARFPDPVPLDQIQWPSAGNAAALDDGRRGLARALELYAGGDNDAADALILSSLYSLERAGALAPELATWHLQTVISATAKGNTAEAEKRALRGLEKFPGDFD